MKYTAKIASVCVATLAFGLIGSADADASTARRNSLMGNRLVLDREDVFAFPQLATQYANLVGFDYGANAETGNALLIVGDKSGAFGVSLHRGNLFASEMYPYAAGNGVLGEPNSPYSGALGAFNIRTGNIVDVFGGYDLGTGLIGARLALGNGGMSATPANDAIDEQSAVEFFTVLQLGYSMRGRLALDTALNIKFSTMSFEQGDETPQSGTQFGVGLDARGIYDLRGQMELGFVGGLNFVNNGLDNEAGGNTLSSSETSFAIQAGVGPVWTIESTRAAAPAVQAAPTTDAYGTPQPATPAPAVESEGDGTTIAAYALLGYQMNSNDPNTDNDDDGNGSSQIILPGLQLAADIELLDWLYFRSGAQYRWVIAGASTETGDGDDSTGIRGPGATSTGYNNGFGWSTGLGVKVGDFRFDGTLANNFLLNGPNFIGGGSGFLTTASAEYTW